MKANVNEFLRFSQKIATKRSQKWLFV